MDRQDYITMDGVSILADAVCAFESEKDFVAEYDSKVWGNKDQKIRKSLLKQVYKIAKSQKDENRSEGD
ncbi:MAG: hypothetical protein CVU66_00755 [Deltaproteobacteria bacterium HGW-Deltaproteobacteria-23]|nr:MAG: hypothetical protein CVU66_00755 [Deltaproteobacteria bacterium HGW-Deltaproteobacteria-23]